MDRKQEEQHAADAGLVKRIEHFELEPGHVRREGLNITEREAARVKELVQRDMDREMRRTQPLPVGPVDSCHEPPWVAKLRQIVVQQRGVP